jgi:hypothetical protein
MEDCGLNKALVAKVYSLMHCQGAQGRARRKAKRTGGPLKQLGGVARREPEGRPEEVGGFCYRTGGQPVLRKPISRTESSFSLVSRWVSGQKSMPSKNSVWLVLAVFHGFWLSFELVWLVLMGVTFVDSNR